MGNDETPTREQTVRVPITDSPFPRGGARSAHAITHKESLCSP